MKLLKTDTGCAYWDTNRKGLNRVITAYNGFVKQPTPKNKSNLKKKIHEFESDVAGAEEKNFYMREVDKICGCIKYDRTTQKPVLSRYKNKDVVFIEAGTNAEEYTVIEVINNPTKTTFSYKLQCGDKIVKREEFEIQPTRYIFSL